MDGLPPNRCLPGGKKKYKRYVPVMRHTGRRELFCFPDAKITERFSGYFCKAGGKTFADPDDVADTVYGLWDTLQDGETVVLTKWGAEQAEGQ